MTATAAELRLSCRNAQHTGHTTGLAPGFVQVNLVVLPQSCANDFALFCERNSKPCPLLERTEPGAYVLRKLGSGIDLRTDLPRYRVLKDGECVDRPTDLKRWWRGDLVSFLIGCSFTFESALLREGIPIRHVEEHKNVPMYKTGIDTTAGGRFGGPLVVSMRPMTVDQAKVARRITARYEAAHGAPIHIGDPAEIGIGDIDRPDFGDPVEIRQDEVCVFWACGVTPMVALVNAKPDFAITHEPGHMLITDTLDSNLEDIP